MHFHPKLTGRCTKEQSRLGTRPTAAQLNLAEAQLAARVRLIDLAVGELRRLRPSA